ncbi:hypothetical protein M1145_00730 [Patescibacteria group bacterium]|nr:hypothetical protein [Patescibacteria group bacterium]
MNSEDLKNSAVESLKNSDLDSAKKAELTKQFLATLKETENADHLRPIKLFYGYILSFFLPLYGLITGVKKLMDGEDTIHAIMYILINIISIILSIYYLGAMFNIGKGSSNISNGGLSSGGLSSIPGNYIKSYKAVSKPIGP